MRRKVTFLFALVFCICSGYTVAVDDSGVPYELLRIKGKVKLDGLSNEAAWEGITPFKMVMQIPDFGKTPSERTEVLAAYDDDYLYIAGRLYDREPGKIQVATKKRDDLGVGSDWFTVVIDTFNDKENALAFCTTPVGLRTDFSIFNDAQGVFPINVSWNTFWDVATVKNEEGWFAEMRIPFSSLRFQDKDGRVTMGMIVWRWIAHNYEFDVHPPISSEWGEFSLFKPSKAREVVLKGVRSRRNLYLAPYVLGGREQVYELNDEETAYRDTGAPSVEAGLDIKYGITSNLTLDVTLNTDFAQVEADDEQVNLTRFSLFFPEKRLFFQERSSIFDFNLGGANRLFYSRQIGIYDDRPVRIYGGARLVGRVGNWDLGAMSMQTSAVTDQVSENFSVMRLRRQVLNTNSYVGAMVTSRLGADGAYNIAYGLDGIFRVFGSDYLTVNWAQTFDDEAENTALSLDPSFVFLSWQRRTTKGLFYDFTYSRCGSAYNPEMGFQDREDYTHLAGVLQYGWIPGEKSTLLNHNIAFGGMVYRANSDNTLETSEVGAAYTYSLKSGFFGNISLKHSYEHVTEGFSFNEEDEDEVERDPDVPIGTYRFFAVEGMAATPQNMRFGLMTTFYAGTFYDGTRLTVDVTPRWSVSASLELSGTFQYNRINFKDRGKHINAHIARLRALAMFSTKLSASAFVQYNGADDRVTANFRLRYNPREGNDFYLVYNEGLNLDRLRETPSLPRSAHRTIMLKYTHTFKL